DRARADVALALRANAVGVRTAGIDVTGDVDGHHTAAAVGRVALREDAVRRVAQHDDVAVLRDRDRTGVAVAAAAAVMAYPEAASDAERRNRAESVLQSAIDVAGHSAATADALREDAV